jgi:O-antigen/teichoic acid export membrane protein
MSLKQAAASGVKWTGASSGLTTALQLLQLSVLTRILSAEEFGLMAIVLVVVGFTNVFADMGFSNALIYRQDATRQQLSTLYWTNLAMGVVLYVLVMASAPLIAEFYGDPLLVDLLAWAGLAFLVTPFGQQFQALLQKEFRFGTIERFRIVASIAGVVIAITTALWGYGVFALVWGQLANSSIRAVALAVVGWREWRPSLHFSHHDLPGFLGFGAYQVGERTVNYFGANVDYVLIGRFLGPETLGVYHIAFQLVIVPLTRINPILTRVAFPVFARRQHDDGALRQGYLEMSKLLAFITFPVLLGMAVTAPVLVPVLFGGRWQEAIPLVQILVGVGILKTLGNPVGSVLLAKGRADIGFKWNLCLAAINFGVFWNVVGHGAQALAWAYLVLTLAYFVGARLILWHVIALPWSDYLRALLHPALIGCAMAGVVRGVHQLLAGSMASQEWLLTTLVGAGLVVYTGLWLYSGSDYLRGLWRMLTGPRPRAA